MKKRIAIVHEFFNKLGGAERTLLSMLDCLGDYEVEVFFLQADQNLIKKHLSGYKVNLSFINKLPGWMSSKNRLFVGLYPILVELFDFSSFDLVLSSSNSFAHGAITNANTRHIVYYHSPCRYLWDWKNEYEMENKFGLIKKIVAQTLFHRQRTWDFLASKRPDVVLANSETVRKRIKKYYRIDSQILYPPVNMGDGSFENQKKDFYLLASTHTPYKKIDEAIKVFNQLGLSLKIAGSGKDTERLKTMANKNIEFLGFIEDSELFDLMKKSKAFVFPGVEDFGITPVEAMSRGCLVVAKNKGGLTETVLDSETGFFYDSIDDLKKIIQNLESGKLKIDPEKCIERANLFSEKKFQDQLIKIIRENV